MSSADFLAELEAAFFAEESPDEHESKLEEAAAPDAPPAKRPRLALEQATGTCRDQQAAQAPCSPQVAEAPQQVAAAMTAAAGTAAGSSKQQTALLAGGSTWLANAAAYQGPPPLLALTDEVLLRVLAYLSPEDLLVTSQVCKLLNTSASDAALWRRLYHTRWPDGPQQEDAEHVQGVSWVRLYLERDEQAVLEARHSAPSQELLPIYVQMATARRSERLSAGDVEWLFRSPVSNNRSLALARKVDTFRRQRNLTDASHHASHTCGKDGGQCTWAQLDSSAWICEKSGFVHVCDANCVFRELDPSSDMQVCRISGRCFAAEMLTEREEHAGEEERGQTPRGEQEQDEEWAADEGVSGRLGRAFTAGYNTQTPAAFFRTFGVRW